MGRPRSDIRPRLVRAARQRFVREGVDGSSLRDVARDAGTSVGMIFYYFPTKDDLFLAVVEHAYAQMLEGIEGVLSKKGASLRDRLRDLSALFGHLNDEEIQVVRLIAREALLSSARFESLFARFRRGHLAMLLHALRGGIAAGEVDDRFPVPVLLLAALGLVAAPQFARRAIGQEPPFTEMASAEALGAALVDIMFRGIERKKKKRPRVTAEGAVMGHAERSSKRART